MFGLQICMTAKKNVVPDQGENRCTQSGKHTTRRSIPVGLPDSSPITRYGKKDCSYKLNSSDENTC